MEPLQMTIPALTPDQLAVVDQYRTCEFATLSRSGLPIAWPISSLLQDDGTFLVTTSIALPQKAFNVRRDGRVALLFSDPTGSGVEHPSEVLVQGTAVCPAEVETTPARSGPLWRRIYERQPASKAYSANAVGRWFAPRAALEAAARDDLQLVFPTIKHLEQLAGFPSADAVLAYARDRDVHPVVPHVVTEGEIARIVLPGEPGYDD
jgi:hypothetical protein